MTPAHAISTASALDIGGIQAALRGWPVRGDELYGSKLSFGPPAELPRDRVIALHACSLTFLHPIRYEPLTVVAPLPELWGELGLAEGEEYPRQDSNLHKLA